MKYCRYLHEYLYFDHYDGNIYICPWMEPKDAIIGNLAHDEIETAYNSDYSNHLRATMDNQTFKYCRREACPHLQNDDLEEISPDKYSNRKKNSYYPTEINLAYDFICNQFCETCRKTSFVPPRDYAEKMRIIHERIAPYLDTAKHISTSGHGDPFASKYMMEVLENMHPTNNDNVGDMDGFIEIVEKLSKMHPNVCMLLARDNAKSKSPLTESETDAFKYMKAKAHKKGIVCDLFDFNFSQAEIDAVYAGN